ncbi:hypothetical protein ACJ41O_003074 [Fusarium nematophilum]
MPPSKPLPDCEGPKLDGFTDDLEAHDFKFLSASSGCHGAVIKAEINGELYAIKFFKRITGGPQDQIHPLYCPADYWNGMPFESNLKKESQMRFQSESIRDIFRLQATSFSNECRAFGRLKDVGREDLAVRVHGYMRVYLTDKVEEQFKVAIANSPFPGEKSGAHLLSRENTDEPVMAIVKDWLPGEEKASSRAEALQRSAEKPRRFPRMLRNLHALHKCSIAHRDIRDQQYINGVLVDFSHAFTIPHVCGPEMGIFPPWTFASMAAWDLSNFQGFVINDWNRFCSWFPRLKRSRLVAYKDLDNNGSYQRLRPRANMQRPFLPLLNHEWMLEPMTQFLTHDPALFDWRAVEKRRKNDTEQEPKRAEQRRK